MPGRARVGAVQAPTFTTGVDLIAVDTQVVDKAGHPVVGLQPSDFQVTFGGARRKVVSADLVRLDAVAPIGAIAVPPPAASRSVAESAASGRYVVLAIDGLSFDAEQSRGVAVAASAFVAKLGPRDRVGLYTYPLGPKIDPTEDHAA